MKCRAAAPIPPVQTVQLDVESGLNPGLNRHLLNDADVRGNNLALDHEVGLDRVVEDQLPQRSTSSSVISATAKIQSARGALEFSI